MRLRRLDLTRYGKFTDASLDFGPATPGSPDLHIVYGLNEAGKSTAFSAYLDLLFGIPFKSGYNFLHDHSNMQIGGVLEFDGAEHAFQRVKRNTNTLLDPRGQPVNEAVLSAALGGIGREAYRTMFSLDDQSLKDGGAAIMESKGDLGELLFSASAGLADVSRILTQVNADADLIHKKRARNTELAQRKQKLVALKEQRAAIDTQASAFAQLVQTVTQADKAYRTAEQDLTEARTRQAALARLLRALPAADNLRRKRVSLADLAGLPRPSRDLIASLAPLLRDETRLETQSEGLAERRARLAEGIDSLAPDAALLALTHRIEGLAESRARDKTAETDLPRRRAALMELNATLSMLLRTLGRESEAEPAALILPAPVTGALRDLIEQRSGIDARLASSRREMQRIEDALDAMNAGDGSLSPRQPARRDISRIADVTGQLRRSDRPARLEMEECGLAKLRQKAEPALTALGMGAMDAQTLRLMPCPDRRQLEGWRVAAHDLTRRLSAHADRIRALETSLQDHTARLSLLTGGADRIDDATAETTRINRDRLWRDHRAALTGETAEAFEAAMQRDDRLTEVRLSRSGELATLRELEAASHMAHAALEREQALEGEARSAQDVLAMSISRAVPETLFDRGDDAVEDFLFRIERFATRRNECLAFLEEIEQAEERSRDMKAEIEAGLAQLAAALTRAGVALAPGMPADSLFVLADDMVAEAEDAEQVSNAREKRQQELKAEALRRERDLHDAEAAADDWQAAWSATLAETWFSGETAPVRVRATLDALSDLPGLLRQREDLAKRIALMDIDQQAFADEIVSLHVALGETASPASARRLDEALQRRHQDAQRASDRMTARQREIAALDEERQKLDEALADHRARRQRLLSTLGVETLEDASVMLERLTDRDQLEQRVSSLETDITTDLRVTPVAEALAQLDAVDRSEAEREQGLLTDRIERLEGQVRDLFGELTLARSRLDAVGGDNAVAAIEAERATVLLDIEDCAMAYLKLKTGWLAASSALELYREKHHSAMMQRASDAFRQITRGDYSGLAARMEKDKEILIGLPRDGGSRLSDAMSTGTRTQLYLALRLAGYEEFAKIRPPVPFVADDIMETFDEPRSEEVFRLFGDMAGMGQVIYLTHHRHLCEIAKSVVPGVRIHAL